MPQLYPNPVSSTSYINIAAGSGLAGGGQVMLGGTVSLSLSGAPSSIISRNCYATSPTPDGTIAEFSIVNPLVPLPAYVDAYINGELQDSDTYVLSGTSISFQNSSGTLPPPNGAKVYVVYSLNDTRNQFPLSPVGSSTTNFQLPAGATPDGSYIDVFVSGVWQDTTAYSLNFISGVWTVVFGASQTSSDIVAVFNPNAFSSRNVYNLTPVTDGTTTTFTIQGGTPTSLYVDTYVAGMFQSSLSDYSLNISAGIWQLAFATAPASGSDLKVVF